MLLIDEMLENHEISTDHPRSGSGDRLTAWLLWEIAEGTASAIGHDFFNSLVRHSATALGVRAAFVTECADLVNLRVRELASFKDGRFEVPEEYDVTGAPCESVMEGRECFYPRQVEQLFPKEQGTGMESYIGLPLVDSSSHVIGHLVVWDGQPMGEHAPSLSVLRIFASRAAAELERQRTERSLQDSDARYRLLFEGNPMPVLVCDALTLGVIAVNEAAMVHYGHTKAAFETMRLHDLVQGGKAPLEARQHILNDGRTIEVEVSRHTLKFGGRESHLLLVNDVTERKKIEAERAQQYLLLEQRVKVRTREIERRRQVAESLRDVLGVLNSSQGLEQILASIVAQAGRLLGTDAGAIYGLPATNELVVQGAQGFDPNQLKPIDTWPLSSLLEQMRQTGRAVALPDVDVSSVTRFRALLAAPLMVKNEVQGCLVLFSLEPRGFFDEELELAATFGTHAALALENARLREDAGRMAVMEERERLSRELHDSVTQSLYSLTLFAETGRRYASAGDLERARDHLVLLGNTAQQTLKEMRLMVHGLRPSALEFDGLIGALRRRLDAVEERAGVMTRLLSPNMLELPAMLEDALFLVAQEALNNSLRHAKASNVTVRLETQGGSVTLEVEDDGCGCDLAAAHKAGGIGLIAMRERAQKLGAHFEVQSEPGSGTRVRLRTSIVARA